jgi:hypothetical protein
MTRKKRRNTTDKGFPIDDRPIIFNLVNSPDINFIGRYVESESMFMLSINDNQSDFVPQTEVEEWWYIDEHPTIISEVLKKKSVKKEKIKKEEKPKYNRNAKKTENKGNTTNQQSFSAPPLPPIPPFLKGFVKHIQQQMGMQFEQVNVRVVGEDELDQLPNNVLEQLLNKAVEDENFELATKIRDIIKTNNNESA